MLLGYQSISISERRKLTAKNRFGDRKTLGLGVGLALRSLCEKHL